MCFQNQERHYIIFAVSPQRLRHSRNDVHVALDSQKNIHRPPRSFFGGMNSCSILLKGNLKANGAYLGKIFCEVYFPGRRYARRLVSSGPARQ